MNTAFLRYGAWIRRILVKPYNWFERSISAVYGQYTVHLGQGIALIWTQHFCCIRLVYGGRWPNGRRDWTKVQIHHWCCTARRCRAGSAAQYHPIFLDQDCNTVQTSRFLFGLTPYTEAQQRVITVPDFRSLSCPGGGPLSHLGFLVGDASDPAVCCQVVLYHCSWLVPWWFVWQFRRMRSNRGYSWNLALRLVEPLSCCRVARWRGLARCGSRRSILMELRLCLKLVSIFRSLDFWALFPAWKGLTLSFYSSIVSPFHAGNIMKHPKHDRWHFSSRHATLYALALCGSWTCPSRLECNDWSLWQSLHRTCACKRDIEKRSLLNVFSSIWVPQRFEKHQARCQLAKKYHPVKFHSTLKSDKKRAGSLKSKPLPWKWWIYLDDIQFVVNLMSIGDIQPGDKYASFTVPPFSSYILQL